MKPPVPEGTGTPEHAVTTPPEQLTAVLAEFWHEDDTPDDGVAAVLAWLNANPDQALPLLREVEDWVWMKAARDVIEQIADGWTVDELRGYWRLLAARARAGGNA